MKGYLNTKDTPFKSIDHLTSAEDAFRYFYVCEKCGKVDEKRFYFYYKNNNRLICKSCSHKSTKGIEAMRESMLQKYGTTSTAQFIDYSKIDYQARNEKSKKTNIEKYGTEWATQSKEVRSKIEQTNIERYGVACAMKSEQAKTKIKQTLRTRFPNGLPGPIASHKKFLEKRQAQIENVDITWLDEKNFHGKYDNSPIEYHFKCNKCGHEFTANFHSMAPVCKNCHPSLVNKSSAENEIYEYIKSIYNGSVLHNDRTVLNGKELDIYLPELKIAIEYNGIYWHGYRKDTVLSLNDFKSKVEWKRLECQKQNIRLINIDEADYLDRPDVFKRFIQDLILPRKRIFARQCKFREISTKEAKDFMEKYHVNGFRGGYYKCGLFYDNELICAAIFGKHKKYENECIRLCYKTGYDIVKGWERIQKRFGKKFLHYVNLKYFMGENKTGCGYRFWIKKQVVYRQQLQKNTIGKYIKNYDPHLSDFQNCLNDGGIAIFDVGNDIRIYNE